MQKFRIGKRALQPMLQRIRLRRLTRQAANAVYYNQAKRTGYVEWDELLNKGNGPYHGD